MEVHHHSHQSHGKKNWKSYFWEFLMLFLAVFCGFLAENQREHYVEHKREKAFMLTLLKDLKNDTGNFDRSIRIFKLIVGRFDTLKSPGTIPIGRNEILNSYELALTTRLFSSFNYSDRTIEQLRSAGNFRLIRNEKVSDSLIEYDKYIRHTYLSLENIVVQQSLKIMELQTEIFNMDLYNFLATIPPLARQNYPIDSIPYKLELLTNDKKSLDRYYNAFVLYRNFMERLIRHSTFARDEAVNLIHLVRKEYNLK